MLRTRRPPSPAAVDVDAHVTVASQSGRRRRRGIVIHSSRTLDPSQVNRQDGIPVTTATRTLEDLRRTRSHPDFAAALRQAEFGGFVVDFNWPARGLIVEVDGWETHRTRSAFENDRARDLRLKLLGLDVIRFTWRQLIDDPADVAAALRELLRK